MHEADSTEHSLMFGKNKGSCISTLGNVNRGAIEAKTQKEGPKYNFGYFEFKESKFS